MENKKTVGVIGAGSFGTAIANLLAEKNNVVLYARNNNVVEKINNSKKHKNQHINNNIIATNNPKELASKCDLIFPIVPSGNFKQMLNTFRDFLTPKHILIHGTKGLHIEKELEVNLKINKDEILTMSELILKETGVVRVGCLAGPNLATEIAEKQIAAAVISSKYNEVIELGKKALSCNRFMVYGSNDIIGIELAGILKNYIAIASGLASGLGYGDNAKALLITRGMTEMIYIAKSLGYSPEAFLGIAGIGDLMATCSSKLSRNFRVGYFLTQNKNLEDIIEEIGEVAEGVKTLQLIKSLNKYGFKAPIANVLYKIIFENLEIKDGVNYLMNLNVEADVDFLNLKKT